MKHTTHIYEAAPSYTRSHIDKNSREYHNKFYRNAHRFAVWTMEQRALRKLFPTTRADKLNHLDFACGTGRILHWFESRTKTSTGVDVSDSMLHVARALCTKHSTSLLQIDITQRPLKGKFDLITAFRFFPNAEHNLRLRALSSLAQHLDNGGKIVFNNHMNSSSPWWRIITFFRPDLQGMSHADVLQLTKSCGLRISKMCFIARSPFNEVISPPRSLVILCEVILSLAPFSALFAQNIIYVCEKASNRH